VTLPAPAIPFDSMRISSRFSVLGIAPARTNLSNNSSLTPFARAACFSAVVVEPNQV